jgi:hypothetical protein
MVIEWLSPSHQPSGVAALKSKQTLVKSKSGPHQPTLRIKSDSNLSRTVHSWLRSNLSGNRKAFPVSNRRFDSLSVLAVACDPHDGKTTDIAIREACRDAGLHGSVLVVGTLADALATVTAVDARFDAAIVFPGVPDGKDIDCLLAIHSACAWLPLVFVSETDDLTAAAGMLHRGAADCIRRNDLEPGRLLRTIRFAIERKLSEAELISLARTDSLTGLLNRRAFFDRLGGALVQARRSELACSVILFDIDNFKGLNEQHGHPQGDRVLRD